MGWDAVVFGELALDGTEGFSRWLEAPVELGTLPGSAECFGSGVPAASSVGAIIDALRSWDRGQRMAFARLSLDLSAERVRIRAFLPESEYAKWAHSLALIWATGYRVGGHGTISFAGFLTAMFEHQVVLAASGPHIRTLGESEILWLEDRPELHEMRVAIADRTVTMVSSDWLEEIVEEDTVRSTDADMLRGRVAFGYPTPIILEPANSPDETVRMMALPDMSELPELPVSEAMAEAAIAPYVTRSQVVSSRDRASRYSAVPPSESTDRLMRSRDDVSTELDAKSQVDHCSEAGETRRVALNRIEAQLLASHRPRAPANPLGDDDPSEHELDEHDLAGLELAENDLEHELVSEHELVEFHEFVDDRAAREASTPADGAEVVGSMELVQTQRAELELDSPEGFSDVSDLESTRLVANSVAVKKRTPRSARKTAGRR